MAATKLSISLPEGIHSWARERTMREGSSLSALIAEGLQQMRQREAWNQARQELLGGTALTDTELLAALQELQT